MRRIFLLITLFVCLLGCTSTWAAQVTDAKWGVDKNNVLRLVVDVDDTVGYAVELEQNVLRLLVNAPVAQKVARQSRVNSSLAEQMLVLSQGSSTVIQLPLKKTISSGDYKAFTLKKDPATKRPFRVVLDITADKRASVAPSTSVPKPATDSRPVVSNRPVKNTSVAKQEGAVTVRPSKNASGAKQEGAITADPSKKDAKPAISAAPSKSKDNIEVIQSKRKFKTNGDLKDMVITIDPGHGGSDPGAIGRSGLKEKTVTLEISKLVQEQLEKKDAKVYMTRTGDKDVFGPNASDREELQARVNVAEKHDSDLFVSLHINSSVNKNVGGFSSYYYPKTEHDLRLAKNIQNKLAANFGVDNLGVREANFYIIKRSSMPAVLLELCFISNEKEEKLMQSKWFQKKAARLIVDGIRDYFKGAEEHK